MYGGYHHVSVGDPELVVSKGYIKNSADLTSAPKNQGKGERTWASREAAREGVSLRESRVLASGKR